MLPAKAVRTWRQALFIVQPETLLRWHRQAFRLLWKRKSKATSPTPRISPEVIVLIREMAQNNRLWGAERMRGELLKLDIRVCKRTIQKYMRHVRTTRPQGQNWATFLHNHAVDIWTCDFLQITDLFFRSLFAFFIIELHSRKVIHVGVTKSPTDAWVAQQLREATLYAPYGQTPRNLIRANESTFGPAFARVAATSSIKLLKTPDHTPRAKEVFPHKPLKQQRCMLLNRANIHTIHTHMRSTSSKLGVISRSAATRFALEQHHQRAKNLPRKTGTPVSEPRFTDTHRDYR